MLVEPEIRFLACVGRGLIKTEGEREMRWARRGGEEKAGRSVNGTTFATMIPDGIF